MRAWTTQTRLGVIALCAALSGCGASLGGVSERGALSITIEWPQRPEDVRAEMIPIMGASIRIELLRDAEVDVEKTVTVNRPETCVLFSELAAGPVIVRAAVYPLPNGEGVEQARGETAALVLAGQTTRCELTLTSTIDHLEIQPAAPQVMKGNTLQLTATAKDHLGRTVIVRSSGAFMWSVTRGAERVTIDQAGLLQGVSVGQAVITCTEPESGKSATVSVVVTRDTGDLDVTIR